MDDYSISAEEAADRIGRTGKALRSWLRATRPDGAVQMPAQKNGRWWLTERLVTSLEAGSTSGAAPRTVATAGSERLQEPVDSSGTGHTADSIRAASDGGIVATDASTPGLEWSDWVPFHTVMTVAPRTPGVYMMRLSAEPELGPVYIGMAGERKGNGLRGRLAIYFSGKGAASGLGEHAFDRALADPAWVEERLVEARERRSMRATKAARSAIDHLGLEVRWTCVATRTEALRVESELVAMYKGQLWNR